MNRYMCCDLFPDYRNRSEAHWAGLCIAAVDNLNSNHSPDSTQEVIQLS